VARRIRSYWRFQGWKEQTESIPEDLLKKATRRSKQITLFPPSALQILVEFCLAGQKPLIFILKGKIT